MIGMVMPIAVAVHYDVLTAGIHITLGVLFASFSDTSGSLRRKVQGMLLTILLCVSVTFLMHFIRLPTGIFLVVLGILIFCIAYISIYGFRASLVSFSGLFAIVLSMSSVSDTDLSVYSRLLLIASGGFWYIIIVMVREALFPKNSTEYHLAESLRFMAEYLKIRAGLIDRKNDRKELIKELLQKQNELTENHETLRELLLSRRLGSGKSIYQARRSLILREIIDILELAMANPVNYFKTDELFLRNPEKMEDFQQVIFVMSERLEYLSRYFGRLRKIKPDRAINKALDKIKSDIQELIRQKDVLHNEDIIALKNYWRYLYNQHKKIKEIEFLIRDKKKYPDKKVKRSEQDSLFLTKQDYRVKVLVENFNSQSGIFRHSVRIAVVGTLGYGLGLFLNLVNSYWVLMTIIIIMRPNFGLTKERFRDRSLGTVAGGILAFVIVYFIHSSRVYGVLAIVSYTIGLSMVHRNYRAAAAFITMYVLFVYSMLHPQVFEFIGFRVLDTLLGAGLAFVGSRVLWPYWEIKSINNTLRDTLKADREYLEEIARYYNRKGERPTTYKLKRKEAFLAMSALSTAFQRMTQEPKSKHESLNEVFQMVMLLHSFLASLASLGTYIVNNETTPASEDFNENIAIIKKNLLASEKALEEIDILKKGTQIQTLDLNKSYKQELEKITETNDFEDDWEQNTEKEEAHLLAEQLKWLASNSQRMTGILKKVKFE